jgi:RES domain-containing protein
VAFDLTDATLWLTLGRITVYRILDAAAPYEPDDPFASSGGRFSNGHRKVLYLAQSPEGAVAEWLRQHPEFLQLQAALRVRVSQVEVDVPLVVTLDVRTPSQTAKIPFPFDRLRSSEADPAVRYNECRDLADECDGSAGIASPSAAYEAPGAWNVVLFGERGDRWSSLGHAPVDRPDVEPALIRLIET